MRSDLDVVLDRAPKAVEYRPLPRVARRVPHRSQLHYEEHVAEVKRCQEDLRALMETVECSNSPEEFSEKGTKIAVLREHLDKMIVLLKIASKVFSELEFAREALQAAIRLGKSTSEIRSRIEWLEERLERLLDKKRPDQVRPKLAILPPPPKNEEDEEPTRGMEETTKKEEEKKEEEKEKEERKISKVSSTTEMRRETEEDEGKEEKEEAPEKVSETFLTECSDDKSVDLDLSASESSSETSHASASAPAAAVEAAVEESQEEPPLVPELSSEDTLMAADEYWSSEHHRVKFADNADVLLKLDPSSYHSLAIVQPGTYVSDVKDKDPILPWRPRRRDSEFEEIHKDALNTLSKRVHGMYTDMHDAAMLSVDPHYKDEVVKGTFIGNLASKDNDLAEHSALALPEMRMPKKAGAGAVYYPTPLLPPVKLPVAKLDRQKIFPPGSNGYSEFNPDEDSPAARIVNQGNLYEDTRFTSSLFHKRRGHNAAAGGRGVESAADEHRLRKWVRESGSASQSSVGMPILLGPEESASEMSKTLSFRNRALAVRGAHKFAQHATSSLNTNSEVGGMLWKNMKPKSGAIQHSGLKWERIKGIVHHNLTSPRPLERQDAARTLGLLRCADAMVLFALRKAMMTDEDLQTRYEATKALMLLGCWEDGVLQHATFFLRRGDINVKTHLLQAMTTGKNVQFVDKSLPTFPKLSRTLSDLSAVGDTEVGFHAAVCLGKLCVADAPSKTFLIKFISESQDDDRIAQACETLVRQMNCTDQVVVNTVLHRLRWSPNSKNRSLYARLLVVLGPRVVCAEEAQRERVFELLESRIWDDPMPEVRTEIAKAIIALDMFPRTCEKAEKKLENPDESIRGQAVMAIGTLSIRNERIIRTLLEMLELDPSEYIRILVIRTFGAIGLPDKRVIRSLQEKEKLETMFANRSAISNEARKSLKILQAGTS